MEKILKGVEKKGENLKKGRGEKKEEGKKKIKGKVKGCHQRGKNIIFGKGGGINIVFGPKYRPLKTRPP
jgi:hypothetical protein